METIQLDNRCARLMWVRRCGDVQEGGPLRCRYHEMGYGEEDKRRSVQGIEADTSVNCVYKISKVPTSATHETLESPDRVLNVVCDALCDPTRRTTRCRYRTYRAPTIATKITSNPPLSVISVDRLPSLLPRGASEAFSAYLLPSSLLLNKREEALVWIRAEKLFHVKVRELAKDGGQHI